MSEGRFSPARRTSLHVAIASTCETACHAVRALEAHTIPTVLAVSAAFFNKFSPQASAPPVFIAYMFLGRARHFRAGVANKIDIEIPDEGAAGLTASNSDWGQVPSRTNRSKYLIRIEPAGCASGLAKVQVFECPARVHR